TIWSLMGSSCAVERRRGCRGSEALAGGAGGAGASEALCTDFAAGLGVLSGAGFAFAGSFAAAAEAVVDFAGAVVFRASRTERRLVGPRTGARRTKTQPTF